MVGLDEFWGVCMSAAIADALSFAGALPSLEFRHLVVFVLSFSFWFCAGLRRCPLQLLHVHSRAPSLAKGKVSPMVKERFGKSVPSGTLYHGRVFFPQVRFRVLFFVFLMRGKLVFQAAAAPVIAYFVVGVGIEGLSTAAFVGVCFVVSIRWFATLAVAACSQSCSISGKGKSFSNGERTVLKKSPFRHPSPWQSSLSASSLPRSLLVFLMRGNLVFQAAAAPVIAYFVVGMGIEGMSTAAFDSSCCVVCVSSS